MFFSDRFSCGRFFLWRNLSFFFYIFHDNIIFNYSRSFPLFSNRSLWFRGFRRFRYRLFFTWLFFCGSFLRALTWWRSHRYLLNRWLSRFLNWRLLGDMFFFLLISLFLFLSMLLFFFRWCVVFYFFNFLICIMLINHKNWIFVFFFFLLLFFDNLYLFFFNRLLLFLFFFMLFN